MYLYRDYNTKGILKCYCTNCGCYHFRSGVGRKFNPGDYMYAAFQQLLGNKTVSVQVNQDEFDYNISNSYETDNDYEYYGILHLVNSHVITHTDATKTTYQLIFEKGSNYGFFGKRLFPWPKSSWQCPYCGGQKFIYGNVITSLEELASQAKFSDADRTYYHDITKEITSDYEELPYRKYATLSNPESTAQDYLKHLVDTETNILFFQKRLEHLYEDEWVVSRTLYDDYLMSALPDSSSIPDTPPKPELKRLGLFNRARIEAENNALLKAYDQSCQSSILAQRKYNSARDTFFENFGVRRDDLREKLDDGDFSDLKDHVPASSLKKAKLIHQEIEECHQHLKMLVVERNELHSMNVVFPKYLTYPAITTIHEYLQCGRCSTLSGPDGAYNLYESELKSNLIIGKLDQILDSLEQIKRNQYSTYQLLQSIEVNTSMLNSSMDDMLDSMKEANGRLSSIERNTEETAYFSHKAACYSAITAAEAATSAYLALYDHS